MAKRQERISKFGCNFWNNYHLQRTSKCLHRHPQMCLYTQTLPVILALERFVITLGFLAAGLPQNGIISTLPFLNYTQYWPPRTYGVTKCKTKISWCSQTTKQWSMYLTDFMVERKKCIRFSSQ